MFDIPVVLFIFKRKDTLKRIIDRIKHVSPCKIYIIADGPRNEEEAVATKEVREYIETLIDWECEIGVCLKDDAYQITKEDSEKYIGGYFLANDVSARDFQLEKSGQFIIGKSAPSFGPIGPFLEHLMKLLM